MKQNRRERGQALVLIILAIVGMFGFAALAVDGGRIYAERRRAQNAADSASFAAAFAASMGQTDWRIKALDQLEINGYPDPDYLPNPGQRMDVQIHNPPLDAATNPGRYDNPIDYFQVIIHTSVDPVFSQIVYNGPIAMTVEAVARARNHSSFTPGAAIFSTSPNSCEAIRIHVSSGKTVKIIDGDIYSSSTRTGGTVGSPDPTSCCSGGIDGSGNLRMEGGGVYTSGSWCPGNGTVDADEGVHTNAPQLSVPTIPPPDCSGLATRSYSGGSAVLEPGIYPNGIKVSGKKSKVTLLSGMYCLGDNFNANGGIIVGEEVMIVMNGGEVKLSGNTTVRLSQNPTLIDASGQKWGGMLIYMPYANTNEVAIGGGAGTYYTGTVYAPGPRDPASKIKCTVLGSGTNIALSSALICYSVEIGGSASVTIQYKEEENYRVPPMMDRTR
jgi:hypothetical protein